METLEFAPLLKRIRWGGRKLGTVLHKPIGDADDYAESWEICDHGEDQSIVQRGPYAGCPLRWLVENQAVELFGEGRERSQFPLLVKFLDATDRLSVQVHPNDEQAIRYDPQENGKTEAWVILDAAPSSRIYAGLRAGIDRATLSQQIEAGRIEDCLHSFTVAAGDCVFIPAGTVHAIGEGILLAEIQQSSDITFRLYDWGRVGADGKPRQLHIEQALDCIDFERGPVAPVAPQPLQPVCGTGERLVDCRYFRIDRLHTEDELTMETAGECHILIVVEGQLTLSDGSGREELPRGQTRLLPGSQRSVRVQPQPSCTFLDVLVK